MTARRCLLAFVAVLSLVLSGCGSAAGPEATPTATGGFVELAISETCVEGSDPECVLIGGDYVLRPSDFDQAPLANATGSEGQNAVEIAFTSDGAAVFKDLTSLAAQAGNESRLLLKVGDELIGATVVLEALEGDRVTIALPPERTPQDVLDLLHST